MKKIELSNSVLDNLDMKSHVNKIGCYHEYFILESGKEHYRLLRYLASKIDTHIIEIGTHCGSSAVALSIDTNHEIITYDVVDVKIKDLSEISNIRFKLTEFMNDLENKELILNSKMIFIDAPHDGIYEKKCYDWLVENNYKGLVVWDDINLNDEMRNFWETYVIPENSNFKKMDVTKYGHITGTGITNFSDDLEIILK
jgi:predicted O-methyltransferase YrrM